MSVAERRTGIKALRVAAVAMAGVVFASLGVPIALAHVSEQAFVLLLPTDIYMTAGVSAVALTVIVLGFLPLRAAHRLFGSMPLMRAGWPRLETVTSLASFALLAVLIYLGFFGSRDPLANPLTLTIWTLWWAVLVAVQGLAGDVWRWINPWTGLHRLVGASADEPPPFVLPRWLGSWPAIAGFLAFSAFMLADPAPDDPARLATIVAAYWLYGFAGMMLFGARPWLSRGECMTVLLGYLATVSAFARRGGKLRAGFPGWQVARGGPLSLSAGIFVVLVLAVGSFDGLNETFWWLAQIGVNPLEFPGRTAVIWPTLGGLAVTVLALPVAFAVCVYLGLRLAGEADRFVEAFGRLARSILPIALGYHIAHYLTVVLVNGQYAIAAASDPFATGADYLGLGTFYVTTGFFNTRDTVEIIWLTQAGAVVLGHIVAVLVAHSIAVDMFGTRRKAIVSQIPLAIFMVLYTWFGLWLLAAPRA